MPPPHADVVAAVIVEGGRVLMTLRRSDQALGGRWEFPGGKVERHETHREALEREIREELGCEVEVGEKVGEIRHVYPHLSVTLTLYRCRRLAGRPRCLEVAALGWYGADELRSLPILPADASLVDELIDELAGAAPQSAGSTTPERS